MPGSGWWSSVAFQHTALVAVGSAVGGIARYWLGRWVEWRDWPGGLPWGTFAVNVSGSFLVGFLAVACVERTGPDRREAYLLLGTGFCGGYTTFSTFELETFRLLRDGHWPAALANVAGSTLFGLLAVFLGIWTAHLALGRQ